MIRTIRGVAGTAAVIWIWAVGGATLIGASTARAQGPSSRDAPRGLPEAPTLARPPAAPNLGPAPGALEPSAFTPQDTVVIGGKARGGSGRVPRKLVKPRPSSGPTTPRGGGDMALPAGLGDSPSAGPSDGSTGSFAEDQGPADGLTLDAALARVLAANLDLLALQYEIPQADADVLTAGLRANPLLYGDAQLIPYGSYTSARPVGPTEYDIAITYPVDVSGKRRARVAVARAAKSAVEAQFQDAARRQVGNLYRAFVDLQASRVAVMSGEAAVRDGERAVGLAARRARPGDDVSRLEVRLDKARDSLNDARDAFEDAREAVALLLSLPADAAARLQPRGGLRDLAPPPPPLEELTRLAMAARPDLVAACRGVKRAEAELKLAGANRVDDVFLFYDPLSYQDNRISRQPSGRSWAIGLTVPLPIYNRNQGNIARARGNLAQSQVEAAALERRVTSEVRLAEREYRASRQALERAERTTLPRALQARARAAADLAAGSIDLTDYFDRLDDSEDAVRAQRDALVRHRRSMLDLDTAVGLRLLP